MTKHTILFLAANPLETDRIALEEEARAIQHALEHSGHRERFALVTRWAAQPLDLLDVLRKLRPTVVHFSGRTSRGVRRGSGSEDASRDGGSAGGDDAGDPDERADGLYFHGPDGRPQIVSPAALEQTFGAAGSSVKLVVLNACYSEPEATALLGYVDCVVGMGGSISPEAAQTFAVGLYGGLGERESITVAYRQGRAAIHLAGLAGGDTPQLQVRAGVDAGRTVLADLTHDTARTESSPSSQRSAVGQDVTEEFDVFLCHNSADKAEVHRVARQLRGRGLRPWLDRVDLRPGVDIAADLQAQISSIKAAAVFIGASGIGPWQRIEIHALLAECVRRGCRLIPVLLPGCPPQPSLPPFLNSHHHVDLRRRDPDPIALLCWGITGRRPGNEPAAVPPRRRVSKTWWSSRASVAAGALSALALLEMLGASALFYWLVARLGSRALAILFLAAVPFVLRTETSEALAQRWHRRVFPGAPRAQTRPRLMRGAPGSRDRRVELVFFSLVAPFLILARSLASAIVMIGIRVGSTAVAFSCHPLTTAREIPTTWWRTVLCIDSHHPLELLDGAHDKHRPGEYDGITEVTTLPIEGLRLQASNLHDNVERYLAGWTIVVFVVLFVVPAVIYRWYLKGSVIFYSVFMFIFFVSRTQTRTTDVHLADILARVPYRLGRYAACFMLLLSLAKGYVYFAWDDLKAGWAMLPGHRLLDALVVPTAFPPWQIAIIASAVIVCLVYGMAEWTDSRIRADMEWPEHAVQSILHVQAIAQWFLCLYVLVCWFCLAASLFGWLPPRGIGLVPWE